MIITKYNKKTDEAAVKEMLANDTFIARLFQKHETLSEINIYVAQKDASIIGILSIGDFYKKTEIMIFVKDKYRRRGIGSLLMKKADEILVANNKTEYAWFEYTGSNVATISFLEKSGYSRNFSTDNMERLGGRLPEYGYTIRNYRDEDYLAYHNISDVGFFIMREKVGCTPSYYQPLDENERRRLAADCNNRFVLLDKGVIIAVGAIHKNMLHLLAVRPDMQSRGYGRALASFLINEIMRRGESSVTLGCVVGNPARYLYDSFGFKTKDTTHFYAKYYKPDSRMSTPVGYTTTDALVEELHTYGMLKEEMGLAF